MHIARTLSDKLTALVCCGLVAALALYVGSRSSRNAASEAVEAVTVSSSITTAAQLLAVRDVLQTHGAEQAETRIDEMVKHHLSIYEELKGNTRIPRETRDSAELLQRRMSNMRQ